MILLSPRQPKPIFTKPTIRGGRKIRPSFPDTCSCYSAPETLNHRGRYSFSIWLQPKCAKDHLNRTGKRCINVASKSTAAVIKGGTQRLSKVRCCWIDN